MVNFSVSSDKSKLNIILIWNYLSNQSYWAKGCSMETVRKSVENSLCFGVYDASGNQAGFARVVTDYATFGWIMDVFILPEFRGQGLGKMLIGQIMAYPGFEKLRRMGLNTRDAHGLYQPFGFNPISDPKITMEIVRKPV